MSRRVEVLARLRDCVVNLDIDGVKRAAKEALDASVTPYEAIMDGMAKVIKALEQVDLRDEVNINHP
jgi:methanogenic corrinoid protein MtbC1